MCASTWVLRGNGQHQFGGQCLYPLRSHWPHISIKYIISIINKIFDVNTKEICLSSEKAKGVDT